MAIEQPETCNFTRCSLGLAEPRGGAQSTAARTEQCRTKAQRIITADDVDRSGPAAVSEGKDSGESLENETRATAQTINGGDGGRIRNLFETPFPCCRPTPRGIVMRPTF